MMNKSTNFKREILANPEKLKAEIEQYRNSFFYYELEKDPELSEFHDRLLETSIAHEMQKDATDMLQAAEIAAKSDSRGYPGTMQMMYDCKVDESLIPYIEKYAAISRLIGEGKRTKAIAELKKLYHEYSANTH